MSCIEDKAQNRWNEKGVGIGIFHIDKFYHRDVFIMMGDEIVVFMEKYTLIEK